MPISPVSLKPLFDQKIEPVVNDIVGQIDAGIQAVTANTIGSVITIPLTVSDTLPSQVKEAVAKKFVEAGWKKVSIVKKKGTDDTVAELTFPTEE